MENSRNSPGVVLVDHLRARGFTVQEGHKPGNYVVTAYRDSALALRPRLSLPTDLLTEYLDAMNRTPGATPSEMDALSLVEVHLEEELTTAGADGRNHATAIGVRRGSHGRVEWFARHADPEVLQRHDALPEDLEWRADPV